MGSSVNESLDKCHIFYVTKCNQNRLKTVLKKAVEDN